MKESIVELAASLVQVPSRAGIDNVERILDFLTDWLARRGLAPTRLSTASGNDVGLSLHLKSSEPGPALCLNACLDTAPFGDEEAWSRLPNSGAVEDGRLYGRGSADSKIAVSIFSHLAQSFHQEKSLPCGELFIVFDADEHTGEFHGIKTFLETSPRQPDAVLIGYPGNDKLITGSRGFLRAELTAYGIAAHSGSSKALGRNAIEKAMRLIESLNSRPLPIESDPYFSFGPKLTVTEVQGGEGFSLIPDRCCFKIDFRLTPNVSAEIAAAWIEKVVKDVDETYAQSKPTRIDWKESWPAYRVPLESPLVKQFLDTAQEVFGRSVEPVVSGPSNIGNYLADRGIPALSGFGVSYKNIHGTDESIEVETIMPVYEVYRRAIARILRTGLN